MTKTKIMLAATGALLVLPIMSAKAALVSESYTGGKESLNTVDKTTFVAAINEVKAQANAAGTSITSLDGRVTATEGDVTTIQGDITDINTSITNIDTSITNIESNITTIGDTLGSVSASDIADMETKTNAAATYAVKATEGVASGAAAKAAANETAITGLQSGKENVSNKANTITGNESDATKYTTTKAVADAISAEVTARNAAISTNNTTVQGNIDAKADKSATGANTSLTTTEKGTLVGAINEVKTQANAAGTSITSLDGRVTATESSVTTIQGNITTINSTLGNKADATDLTGLATETFVTGAVDAEATARDTAIGTAITGANLKALSHKDTVATADIDAKAVTSAKLADEVNDAIAAKLPKPTAACTDPDKKCVLITNGATFEWEVVER
ncbi:MAG: hypothetical protein LBK26_04380 [Rickettsiales bacterium]|jgi:chromosome segregation ATPase|nr:hypothetical protein [Rickettsiales bacterium]